MQMVSSSSLAPVSPLSPGTQIFHAKSPLSTRTPRSSPKLRCSTVTRVMRPILGRVTASPIQDLLNCAPRLLDPPRAAHQEQLLSKLWVCQRCYHHSQRALGLERIRAVQRNSCPRLRPSGISFSKYPSRALSTDSSNAADKPRSDLPSQEEGRRSHLSKRFSHVMDHLQSNIFIAGQRLNDLTGYSGIEALKKDIEQQGRSSTHLQPFRR